MNKIKTLCQYNDPDNHDGKSHKCPLEANDSGFCYWHDKSIDKSGPEVKQALVDYAQSGGMLRGLVLTKAQLEGIDLVNHHKKVGYDFSYCDLYHANLKGGHLFNINLANASIMKADLREANLNCANLENANMLGVKWLGSKFENIKFGAKLKQEKDAEAAKNAGNTTASIDYLEQA